VNLEATRRAPPAEVDGYDLSAALPIGGADAVPAGTSLLFAGDAMGPRDGVALDALAGGITAGEHAVVLSPDHGAARLQRRLADRDGRGPGTVRIVDCTGAPRRQAFAASRAVRYVSDPGDLTGIGIEFVKSSRDLDDRAGDGVRVALFSVSTLLQHVDPRRVFRFLQAVTGRVAGTGYLFVATIDPGGHDARTVNAIRSQFDAVVEYGDDDASVRVRGLDRVDGGWHPL